MISERTVEKMLGEEMQSQRSRMHSLRNRQPAVCFQAPFRVQIDPWTSKFVGKRYRYSRYKHVCVSKELS